MKKIFFASTLAFISAVALADIPRPKTNYTSETFSGPKAQAKYEQIQTPVLAGNTSGWTGTATQHKVARAPNGLEQVVCTKTFNFRQPQVVPTFSCTYTKSTDGTPVPVFVVHHIMG